MIWDYQLFEIFVPKLKHDAQTIIHFYYLFFQSAKGNLD